MLIILSSDFFFSIVVHLTIVEPQRYGTSDYHLFFLRHSRSQRKYMTTKWSGFTVMMKLLLYEKEIAELKDKVESCERTIRARDDTIAELQEELRQKCK